MKSIIWIALTCIAIINASGCSNEFDNEIEAELQAHFDNFVVEASAHGMEISLIHLDIGGYLENIEQRGTLGQCKTYSNGSKTVIIDQPYWNQVNELQREYLVFHELGHCILNRDHKDVKDENGNCLSIMQSGESECKGIYDLQNRQSLLDELFEG